MSIDSASDQRWFDWTIAANTGQSYYLVIFTDIPIIVNNVVFKLRRDITFGDKDQRLHFV